MADLLTVVDYYVDRLILQYRTKRKARDTVAIAVRAVLADDVASHLSLAFDIDTAQGPQLDILGKYVGVSRNIGRSFLPGLFSFWTYAATFDPTKYQGTWDPGNNVPPLDPAGGGNNGYWYVASTDGTSTAPLAATFKCGDIVYSDGASWLKSDAVSGNGFTTYSDLAVNVNGIFWSYAAASRAFSALTDESYRVVIKLQSILNHSDGSLASLVDLFQTYFPRLINVVDHKNMHLTYTVVSTVPLSIEVLNDFLPAPMGVQIEVIIVNPTPEGGGKLTTEAGDILTTESGEPLTTEAT